MAVREKTLTRTSFAVKHVATGSTPSAGAHKKFWRLAQVHPELRRVRLLDLRLFPTTSRIARGLKPVKQKLRCDQFRLGEARWLKPHTYAASADTWSGVSCAPPIGGMGLRYCFGCDTPSVIVFLIPA